MDCQGFFSAVLGHFWVLIYLVFCQVLPSFAKFQSKELQITCKFISYKIFEPMASVCIYRDKQIKKIKYYGV